MEYGVGDRIVYPLHGAGIIDSIEEKEVLGESRRYYNLKLSHSNLQLKVPVDNAGDLGIRPVMAETEVGEVFRHLKCPCAAASQNWNKRYRESLDKLRSGNIYEAAEVYKSLRMRERDRSLSTGEKKLLTTAKNILFSELVLASGKEIYEVEEEVNGIIDQCIEEL